MTKQVGWRWVPGMICPYCHSAVQWMTQQKEDRHSVTGFSEYREPIRVELEERASDKDVPFEKTIHVKGHQETVQTHYVHSLDCYCPECNLAISSSRLLPGEPDEYPVGYWVEV